MIHIYCGDDIAVSRKNYIDKINFYKQKQYSVIELTPASIEELDKWLYQSTGLFNDQKVFIGENLLKDKISTKILQNYQPATTDIILWQSDVETKSIKLRFKQSKIFESKLPDTIFKFLDSVYPGNLKSSLKFHQSISQTIEPNIILYMLQKTVKQLLIIKGGVSDPKLASWQFYKLKNQASKYNTKILIAFYQALNRLEQSVKSSATPFDIKQGLDILLCNYLN